MNEEDKQRLIEWAATRPESFYVHHPNSDRAARALLQNISAVGFLQELESGGGVQRARCPLSVRELQTLGGFAAGLSAQGVADYLGVGEETIRRFAKSAYRKLCLPRHYRDGSQRHAVAIAIREGWL